MPHEPIFVTKPTLPPLEELLPALRQIWTNRILTNGGPFHQLLEEALCAHLSVERVALFANGTIALVTALQALEVKGEVITTPFSFVATSHSLLWNGMEPVFVDIDPDTLNLAPARIEAAITSRTTAVMPVHCYGHPCDTDGIRKIAAAHRLKVIYDAAHAFGVEDAGGSILRHGDISVLSFHATKVFNTFEGGAIVCRDEAMKLKIDQLKNFGHQGETTVVAPGINGKMSEFNAALGVLQLKYVDDAIRRREAIHAAYRERLSGVSGIRCFGDVGGKVPNYAYFPILVEAAYPITRDALYDRLKERAIHTRRYFYPLISDFPMYRHLPSARPANLPVATATAQQILCLPIYPDLATSVVDEITGFIADQ